MKEHSGIVYSNKTYNYMIPDAVFVYDFSNMAFLLLMNDFNHTANSNFIANFSLKIIIFLKVNRKCRFYNICDPTSEKKCILKMHSVSRHQV